MVQRRRLSRDEPSKDHGIQLILNHGPDCDDCQEIKELVMAVIRRNKRETKPYASFSIPAHRLYQPANGGQRNE